MNKLFKILEVIWLCTAGLTALIAVYFLVMKDNDASLFFVFAFLISAIMYLLRRYQRKKQEAFLRSQQKK